MPADPAPPVLADPRARRLRFRSWHRGTREMDLILGRFADRNLASFSGHELGLYERLLEENDPDLYNWMTGREPVPTELDHEVMRRLKVSVFEDAGTAKTPQDRPFQDRPFQDRPFGTESAV